MNSPEFGILGISRMSNEGRAAMDETSKIEDIPMQYWDTLTTSKHPNASQLEQLREMTPFSDAVQVSNVSNTILSPS